MNLLALETATSACSVALSTADACVGRHAIVEQRHTECLFEMIDETLAEAGVARTALDAVAFGIGPGSFTGVRVAAATAQGIAAARNLPVVGISTLAVLAATATGAEGGAVLAALDARRGEVYVAAYELEGARCTTLREPALLAPEAVAPPAAGDCHLAGNAWSIYAERFDAGFAAFAPPAVEYPDARALARLARAEIAAGRSGSAADALPLYLRGAVD